MGEGQGVGLWDRGGVQYGHLVGGRRLRISLILAGGAAGRGRAGRWGGGGSGMEAGGTASAVGGASATGSGQNGVLLLRPLAGELGDAEDELEATQFDVAAVVKQGRALPARPAAPDQSGAARLAVAGALRPTLSAAAHHPANR